MKIWLGPQWKMISMILFNYSQHVFLISSKFRTFSILQRFIRAYQFNLNLERFQIVGSKNQLPMDMTWSLWARKWKRKHYGRISSFMYTADRKVIWHDIAVIMKKRSNSDEILLEWNCSLLFVSIHRTLLTKTSLHAIVLQQNYNITY